MVVSIVVKMVINHSNVQSLRKPVVAVQVAAVVVAEVSSQFVMR